MAYNDNNFNFYNHASVNNNENLAPSMWQPFADLQSNVEASNTTIALNILQPMLYRNTEESLDLTISIENMHARSTPLFLGRDTPNVTPQKYEMPTVVTTSTDMVNPGFASTITTPFGALLTPQPRPDFATQTLTAQLPKPIAIITPSANSNFSLTRELEVDNSPSSTNVDNTREMQPRKKMKTKTVTPYTTDLVRNYLENHTIIENGREYVEIGTNGTKVQKQFLQQLNWNGPGAAITRKLLTFLFDRQTLATHTISGKPSPAFLGLKKTLKSQLNPLVINDLIEFMAYTKGLTPRDVKIAISKKCGYECINYRRHQPAAASTPVRSETNVITPS